MDWQRAALGSYRRESAQAKRRLRSTAPLDTYARKPGCVCTEKLEQIFGISLAIGLRSADIADGPARIFHKNYHGGTEVTENPRSVPNDHSTSCQLLSRHR